MSGNIIKIKAFVKEHIPILVSVKRLVWKFPYLPYLLMAIPCVALLRIIKFWKVFRFGQLDGNIFGHFWTPEIYLCERDLGWQEQRRIIDIFYTVAPAVNQALLKKWQEHIRLFPQNRLLEMIDSVNRWIPGYKDHVITLKFPKTANASALNKILLGRKPAAFLFHQDAGAQLLNKTKQHITFTPEEERIGKQALREMGLSEHSQYICFHTRDRAHGKEVNPKRNLSHHDFRDANIQNYLPMAEKFTQEEFYMVRMGAKVVEPLNTTNPRIIDYPLKYRTEFMDLYLGANCRFFITSLTGMTTISTLFRRPTVFANVIPYHILYSWTEYDLFIPKKLWLRKEKRFLTFREIVESEVCRYDSSESYTRDGIEVIENTPGGITGAALEMNERLKGTWKTTEEDEQLQQRFQTLFKPNKFHGEVLLRIGAEFLHQNRELLG